METQQQDADDWASKFTENTNVSMSTSGENFANFTDISKFEMCVSLLYIRLLSGFYFCKIFCTKLLSPY